MKLAESVRVRWVLAAASLAFAGSAAALIATRAPAPSPITRHETPPIHRGCHVHLTRGPTAKPRTPTPEVQKRNVVRGTSGADYRDALLAIQPALDSCVKKSSNDVTYRLSIDIKGDGSVGSVDVRSEADDMRKVSLKTTQCLERAVMTASFPAAGQEKRVSTVIRPDSL